MSIVRENLMNIQGYTPYCGNLNCNGGLRRTHFINDQFRATCCNWVSEFPPEFIAEYKAKWNKDKPHD